MPTPVKMPRLGESVAEGTVGSWLKNEGDWVEKDESLAEIITDKINAELPSPVAGRLERILVQPDQTVSVGTDIALIEENTDVSAAPPAEPAPGPDAAPVEDTRQAATPVMEEKRASTSTSSGNGASAGATAPQREEEERQRISPLARRLAREHDVDLSKIAGTGTGGRVRKEDILAYVEQRQAAPGAATTATAAAAATTTQYAQTAREVPQPAAPVGARFVAPVPEPVATQASPTAAPGEDVEVVTPSRMRLAIAEHMVRSKRTAPHATTVVEVDMTNIAKWLEKNKEDFKRREGYGISYVPFVMKAVCEGIRKFPIIN